MEINFKHNLVALRQQNQLSQEQLAEKLEVSRQAVSKWESGEAYPEMKILLSICQIFNVKLDDLVHGNIQDVDDNLRQKYDQTFSRSAKHIALGEGLILLGVALMLGVLVIFGENSENVAVSSCAILVLFIAAATTIFTLNAHKIDEFKRKYRNLPEDLYDKTSVEARTSLHHKGIAIAIGAILVSVSIFLILNAFFENHVAATAILMFLLSLTIPALVYNAMQKGKYNITKYNHRNSKAYRLRDKRLGIVCGAIMMSANVIFLLTGVTLNAWETAWVVYPVGGIICGIISAFYHQKEELDLEK